MRDNMTEFKDSNLFKRLNAECNLSEDAKAFMDASMDDFLVDEYDYDEDSSYYEIRGTLIGFCDGEDVRITQIYDGNLTAMNALIEHLALVQRLLNNHLFGMPM